MTRFVYNTASTLNGFLADDEDSLSWLFSVPGAAEAEDGMAHFLAGVGAFVMGATTYRWVLDNDERENEGSWAAAYGELPCFVVTHRALPTPAGGKVRFVSGAVDTWVADVEREAGEKDVWLVGGGDLVGQFDDVGRLDEIRVSLAPALLASGRPLLPRTIGSDRLRLTTVKQEGQFAELSYRVSRPV
ncbi:dihydrofolate reductase family protein [Microbacterium sp. P05]|uniref:dihydrofolate reductase family protein n=1 Tax=Microbacterium sp. P05 TaxID=3366948 RepID=UPI0037473E1A